MEADFNTTAKRYGYPSVHNLKKAIAFKIKEYIVNGGFLFAMCSATDSFDIALAAGEIDIVDTPFDGTPVDYMNINKLQFGNAIAFENYDLTFMLHAATERNLSITDNWLSQIGITTQSVMSASIGRRLGE